MSSSREIEVGPAPPLFRARNIMSDRDSDPTLQGHPAAWPTGGLHWKSAFARLFNLTETGAGSPAECDITLNLQIAHVQIPLHPGAR